MFGPARQRAWTIAAATAAACLVGCATTPDAEPDSDDNPAMAGVSSRLATAGERTRQHLQQRLMGFVDRAMSRMEEATDGIVFATQDPAVRSAAHETKYYTMLAMVSLAADVRPEVSLIDLMVMTRLERSKWAEAWCDEFMGPSYAAALRDAQSAIERDIWSIGSDYLSVQELEKLQGLVDDWRAANPDRKYLTRVRLDSIAQMRSSDDFTSRVTGGIFAPVSEAARAAEEIKLLGERAIYLAERAPLLLAWQAEVLAYDLARAPEVNRLLANTDALTQAAQEAALAIAQLESGRGSYAELLQEVRETLQHADATSGRVQEAVVAARELAAQTDALIGRIDETLKALSATADRFLPRAGEGADPGAGPREYRNTVEALTTAIRELNELARQTDSLLQSAAWNSRVNDVSEATRTRVDQAEDAGEALINLAFERGLMLLGAAAAMVVVVAVILRLIPRRPALKQA